LRFFFDRPIQRIDLLIEHGQQPQQIFPPPPRPRLQRQLAQHLLSRLAPQLVLALHPLIQAQMLQLVLHPRPNHHQLVTMQQQLPQIAHLRRRHPDPRKPPLLQQNANMLRVPSICLLPPHATGPDLRRIPHPQLVAQLGQQIHQPVTVARRFHPDQRRRRQLPIKPLGIPRGLHQLPFPRLSRLRVQPRNLLPAGMKITSYNHHCEGSFLSEKP